MFQKSIRLVENFFVGEDLLKSSDLTLFDLGITVVMEKYTSVIAGNGTTLCCPFWFFPGRCSEVTRQRGSTLLNCYIRKFTLDKIYNHLPNR